MLWFWNPLDCGRDGCLGCKTAVVVVMAAVDV